METKLVRVPFEVELAKRIQNGECEGRIVTRDGRNVRVVCWDYKSMSGNYPIFALIDEEVQEQSYTFSENGKFNIFGYENENNSDLMLEITEYMTFKNGDIIAFGNTEDRLSVGIFKKRESASSHECYVMLSKYGVLNFDVKPLTYNNARFATEAEKQKLITALKESKEPKAKEYLKRFFGIEQKAEYEFKPFDKVICRDDYSEWFVDMFSHIDKNGLYACIGHVWNYCIPYNDQTAHLLGTTEDYNG